MISVFVMALQCLWAISLLAASTVNAANYTINVAALFPMANCHTLICSTELAKTNILDASNLQQPAGLAMQGYVTVEEKIRELGGIPIGADRVFLNITHFNYSPWGVNSTIARRDASQMAEALMSGVYGNFTVLMPYHTNSAAIPEFSRVCESSKRCIVLTPLSSSRSIFFCAANTPECIASGRFSGQRRFDYTFTILPDTAVLLTGWLPLVKYKQARTIAILGPNSDSFIDSIKTLETNAISLNIKVVFKYISQEQEEFVPGEVTSFVADMRAADPDVVAIFGFSSPNFMCRETITEMLRINWAPRFGLASGGNCLVSSYAALGENLVHTMYDVPWHHEVRGPEYRAVTTSNNFEVFPATEDDDIPQVFTKEFQALYPQYPLAVYPYAVLGAQAMIAIQKIVSETRKVDPTGEDLRNAALQLAVPSLNGRLQFDQYGRNVPPVSGRPVIQIGPRESQTLVTPLALGRDPVWPFPSWDERIPNEVGNPLGSAGEKIIYAVTVICIVYALVLLYLMFMYRHTNTVRAATPVFCYLTLVGAVVWMSTVFVWTENETTRTCNAKIWLLQLGFTMTYSAIFIKTFRLWRIFMMVKLQVVRITNRDLLIAFAIWLAAETVYTIIWISVAPTQQERVVVDPLRPSMDYFICSRNAAHNGFAAGAVAIKGFTIAAGCFVTWATRKIPGDFNESKFIGLSVYNLFFITAIAVPITAAEVGSRRFNFYFRAFAILFIAVTTITLNILSKVWTIQRDGDVDMPHVQHHTMISVGGGPGTPNAPVNAHGSSPGGSNTPDIAAQQARIMELERLLQEVRAQTAREQERVRFLEKQLRTIEVVELPGCPS